MYFERFLKPKAGYTFIFYNTINAVRISEKKEAMRKRRTEEGFGDFHSFIRPVIIKVGMSRLSTISNSCPSSRVELGGGGERENGGEGRRKRRRSIIFCSWHPGLNIRTSLVDQYYWSIMFNMVFQCFILALREISVKLKLMSTNRSLRYLFLDFFDSLSHTITQI